MVDYGEFEEWTVCINKPKMRYEERKKIRETYPDMIRSEDAIKIQKELKIKNFYKAIMSEGSKKLQRDGWIYVTVIHKGEGWSTLFQYRTITIHNKWEDKIVFRKGANHPDYGNELL